MASDNAASTDMSSVTNYGNNVTTSADTVAEGTSTGIGVTPDINTSDGGLGTANTSETIPPDTTSATSFPALNVTVTNDDVMGTETTITSRQEDQTGRTKDVNTVAVSDPMQTTEHSGSTLARVESTTVQGNMAISLTPQVTTASGLTSDVTSDVIPSDTPRDNATTLDSTPGLQEPGSTTFSPPTKHARTTKGYSVLGTTHTASASTHRVPASTHTVPASTHTDPASTHTDPATTHRAPASTYTELANATSKPGTSSTYPESTSKHPGSTFETQGMTDVTTGKHLF